MKESVILIDENDQMIGTMDKMAAHWQGKLHRAFSVFIFNTNGELLLQQRALGKYHSAGQWSNTCCSHPKLGEKTLDAAHRRLSEEMGLTCELDKQFNFTYREDLLNGLTEHEFDHVYFGVTDAEPILNPDEVAAYKYVGMADLEKELNTHPEHYSKWLYICFDRVLESYNKLFNYESMAD